VRNEYTVVPAAPGFNVLHIGNDSRYFVDPVVAWVIDDAFVHPVTISGVQRISDPDGIFILRPDGTVQCGMAAFVSTRAAVEFYCGEKEG
jgi:hypothetical protein